MSAISDAAIKAASEAARDEFFRALAAKFPHLTSGDLPPMVADRFAVECEDVAHEWVEMNRPHNATFTLTVKLDHDEANSHEFIADALGRAASLIRRRGFDGDLAGRVETGGDKPVVSTWEYEFEGDEGASSES